MEDKTMPTDEQIVAAVHKACGIGRVSLTHINNDGEEVPTDVAKCFARALVVGAASYRVALEVAPIRAAASIGAKDGK